MSNPIQIAEEIETLLRHADISTASAALQIAKVLFEHRVKGDAVAAAARAFDGPETELGELQTSSSQ